MSAQSSADEWQVLIFDTGPLWELILYSAVHQLRFQSLEGELRHLKKPEYHSRLAEFVNRFPQRTTSSQVVSEIGAWISRTKKPGRSDIWRIVRDEFEAMEMDEMAMKFLEMRFDLVANNGIADASVLHLGLRLAKRRPQVLTIDRDLETECKRNGVGAVNLWEIIG
jgi:hypothetical protein